MGSLQGIICTPEEYERSLQDPLIHCLTRPETMGVIMKTEAGFLSLIAVLYVVFLVLRNVRWRIRHLSRNKFRIFHQPIDLLMCSLFFADFLQATGTILNITWIKDGKVEAGEICNAQGTLSYVGEAAVAITTVTIAFYTFIGMWMVKDLSSMKTALGVVCGTWFLVAFLAFVGNVTIHNSDHAPFAAPTPLWCWIRGVNRYWWRMLAVYIWIWLSLLCSLSLYFLLYLWMRGNIDIDEQKWWKFSFRRNRQLDPTFRSLRQRSSIMLAYPLANSIAYVPISIVRWIGHVNGRNPPLLASILASSLLSLSGFINVVLLLSTRPESGLFGHLMHRHPAVPLLPLLTSETSPLEIHDELNHSRQNSHHR